MPPGPSGVKQAGRAQVRGNHLGDLSRPTGMAGHGRDGDGHLRCSAADDLDLDGRRAFFLGKRGGGGQQEGKQDNRSKHGDPHGSL